VVRGAVDDVAAEIASRENLKGEVVLLIGPPPARVRKPADPALVRGQLDRLIAGGLSRSEAVKRVAGDLDLPRSEVYDIAHRPVG
jgi:16S rRNA (cytidine1402-2'-O)-methyltransferase